MYLRPRKMRLLWRRFPQNSLLLANFFLQNSCSEYHENVSEYFVAVSHRRAGMASVKASLS
jgi:glutathionylspermidine synthase